MIAVLLERGPAWDPRLPLAEQAGFPEHVALITGLLDEGVALAAGPFADPGLPTDDQLLALALLDLDSVDQARGFFATDPIVAGEVVTLHAYVWGGTALRRAQG